MNKGGMWEPRRKRREEEAKRIASAGESEEESRSDLRAERSRTWTGTGRLVSPLFRSRVAVAAISQSAPPGMDDAANGCMPLAHTSCWCCTRASREGSERGQKGVPSISGHAWNDIIYVSPGRLTANALNDQSDATTGSESS